MEIPEGTYRTKVMRPVRSCRVLKAACESCNGRGELRIDGEAGLVERRRCPACSGRGYEYLTK